MECQKDVHVVIRVQYITNGFFGQHAYLRNIGQILVVCTGGMTYSTVAAGLKGLTRDGNSIVDTIISVSAS